MDRVILSIKAFKFSFAFHLFVYLSHYLLFLPLPIHKFPVPLIYKYMRRILLIYAGN